MTTELLDLNTKKVNKWKLTHKEYIKDYNKLYYEKTKKSLEIFNNNKDKIYEKSICECGGFIMINHKASKLRDLHSKKHSGYIN